MVALQLINYGLVLAYGLFLSVEFAGSYEDRRQKRLVFALLPALLLIQSVCWRLWGAPIVERIYPLIVHLPLMLFLIAALKKRVGVALTSVCTAYLCCQIPNWLRMLTMALTHSALAAEIVYTVFLFAVFFLLQRYFVRAAHEAMRFFDRAFLLFGCLPIAYYVFDYATVVYSDALYIGIPALMEFFPTALTVFYVMFLTAYHAQMQNCTQAELQRSMLEAQLKQAETEMQVLRRAETQTAFYRHNMRHHLNAIEVFLSSGKPQQAEEYIRSVQADVEAVTPLRFCENELVNLLCSSFSGKAAAVGAQLVVEARLPQSLPFSDTELCSIISNTLENALHAVSALEAPIRKVSLYCGVRANKLLIEVKNPYAGEIVMRGGLPVVDREGHGYGCRSIRAIAQQHGGLCSFEALDGEFSVQVLLPLPLELEK